MTLEHPVVSEIKLRILVKHKEIFSSDLESNGSEILALLGLDHAARIEYYRVN